MSHYTFDLERSISKVKYSKIAKMQKSFFCHDSAANNPIYFKKRPKYSSTVPILPRYILVKVEVKDQGQDVKMPIFFWLSVAYGPIYFRYRPQRSNSGAGMLAVPRTAHLLVNISSVKLFL